MLRCFVTALMAIVVSQVWAVDTPSAQVATPWQIRQQAEEILEQLRQSRGALSDRLSSAEAFMAEHGDALIPISPQQWRSVSDVISQTLIQQELADEFNRLFDHQAQATWQQLTNDDAVQFRDGARGILRRWPLTDTAQQARLRLARYYWDRGQIGAFLNLTDGDPSLQRQAAIDLLLPPPLPSLPTIDKLMPLWRIDTMPVGRISLSSRERQLLRRQMDSDIDSSPARLYLRSSNSLVAASDGQYGLLFDPLLGSLLSEPIRLAFRPVRHDQPTLAIDERHAAFVGRDQQGGLKVLLYTPSGEMSWQQTYEQFNRVLGTSAPILDREFLLLAVQHEHQGGSDLDLVAISRATGRIAWQQTLARKSLQQRFARFRVEPPPLLCRHAGYFVVADNRGLIATVDNYGQPHSVWSYPSVDREEEQQLINLQVLRQQRRPHLLSSGKHLILAPHDHPGMIILTDGRLQTYTGVGASDRPVAVEGSELFAVGQHISMIDLAELQPI